MIVSWTNRSVDVPSCPTLPRPAALPCAARTRSANDMSGFWNSCVRCLGGTRVGCRLCGPFRRRLVLPGLASLRRSAMRRPDPTGLRSVWVLDPTGRSDRSGNVFGCVRQLDVEFLEISEVRPHIHHFSIEDSKLPGADGPLQYAEPVEPQTRTYHGRNGSRRCKAGRRGKWGGDPGPGSTGRRRVGSPRRQATLLRSGRRRQLS